MRLSTNMIELKEYWSECGDRSAANRYYRVGNAVVIGTIYRFSNKKPIQILPLKKYDDWVGSLSKLDF